MEPFKHLYMEACDSLKIEPERKILLRLEEIGDGNNLTLNLSSCMLSEDACKALSYAIAKDVHLTELDLSDCMLTDKGLTNILSGIEKNKFLLTLCLKGNNIKSIGTEAIGKLLRHNNHLHHLLLEWNAVGLFPEKFAILCGGLSLNTSLQSIDLRNNQINHNCAPFLTEVLLRNSTLHTLDLSSNNLGLIGGRILSEALTKNKTICRLHITGNNVPFDTEHLIDVAASHNAHRFIMRHESLGKIKQLTTKLGEVEKEKHFQNKVLMEKLEKKDQDIVMSQRQCSIKLNQLQESVEEKDAALACMTQQSKELHKSFSEALAKLTDLDTLINETKNKNKGLQFENEKLLAQSKEELIAMQNRFLADISKLKEENLTLEQQVQTLTKEKRVLEEQAETKEMSLSKAERQLQNSDESYQEQLSLLNEKHKRVLKEKESEKEHEVLKLREEFGDVEKERKHRITLRESQNALLEQELKDMKSRLDSEKARHETAVEKLKKQTKDEHDKLQAHWEEKLALVEKAKEKQERLLKENLEAMYKIKKKATALGLEMAEKNHQLQKLQQDLKSAEEEKVAAVAETRFESAQQTEELKQLREAFQQKTENMEYLKKKLEELQQTHREELHTKMLETEHLKGNLREKDSCINMLKENIFRSVSQMEKDWNSHFSLLKNVTTPQNENTHS